MLLATGAFTELIRFFQIVGWIILPVMMIAGGLTTYLHYRRKKRLQAEDDTPFEFELLSPPESIHYKRSDGEYILFDHSALFRKYKRMLTYNRARYTALRHDFSALATKYSSLVTKGQHPSEDMHSTSTSRRNRLTSVNPQISTLNSTAMQPYNESMNQEEEINLLRQVFEAERLHWQSQMAELNDSYCRLEQENQLLMERKNIENAPDDERQALLAALKDEKEKLLDQIFEQAYLAEVLEDKKSQIGFLQEQLEQRVIASHQAERDRQLAMEERNGLQQELQQKEIEFSAQLSRQEQVITLLHEELAAERERARMLEERMTLDKQALRRMHADLALLLDDTTVQPTVIQLLPAHDGPAQDIAAN